MLENNFMHLVYRPSLFLIAAGRLNESIELSKVKGKDCSQFKSSIQLLSNELGRCARKTEVFDFKKCFVTMSAFMRIAPGIVYGPSRVI